MTNRPAMRFAYADPPYLGRCSYYRHDHPRGDRPFDGRCWNDVETHLALIGWLDSEYPDGWALSASAPSLRDLLPRTPADVRIAPWVKTFCAFKRNVRPAYAWEPVMFRSRANPPHRFHAPPLEGGKQNTPKDFFAGRITLQKGLTGSKSVAFCAWVLSLLNAQRGDVVDDLFPGVGGMRVAFEAIGGP
jgi:hypothetical protein